MHLCTWAACENQLEVAGDVPKDGVDGPCGRAGGGDTGDRDWSRAHPPLLAQECGQKCKYLTASEACSCRKVTDLYIRPFFFFFFLFGFVSSLCIPMMYVRLFRPNHFPSVNLSPADPPYILLTGPGPLRDEAVTLLSLVRATTSPLRLRISLKPFNVTLSE